MTGTVLLVEDGRQWYDILRPNLQGSGYGVVWVQSKEEAFEFLFSSQKPDVAVVNLNLDKDVRHAGVKVLKRLQQRWPKLPRILISTRRNDEVIAKLRREGSIEEFCEKPRDDEEDDTLVDLVGSLMKRPASVPVPPTTTTSNSRFDVPAESVAFIRDQVAASELDAAIGLLRQFRPRVAAKISFALNEVRREQQRGTLTTEEVRARREKIAERILDAC